MITRLPSILAADKPFHVPEAGHLFNYEPVVTIGPLELTWPMLLLGIITILLITFWYSAFRAPKVVPSGVQNVGEFGFEFVQKQIAFPVLGPNAGPWVPFLVAIFFWVFFLNLMGITPGVNFPITSRMAIPATIAAVVWLIFNGIGIRNQGPIGYFKNMMFPPGVPWPIYVILAPIEFFSTVIFRPLTLALRLFANMVAGHMLLSVLAIATAVFINSGIGRVAFVLPFAFGVIMTGFEIFVAFMQAFIITILTGVYIAGAQEAHH
ncbi:MAG TPA: F0F1 ATP synthase subunit A [Actinomycetota bacterium]